MLADVVATATPDLLPSKQMNEVMLSIKSTLFAAAAAYSYTTPHLPSASRATAAELRSNGVPVEVGYAAGNGLPTAHEQPLQQQT
jgi:hypothetical protein